MLIVLTWAFLFALKSHFIAGQNFVHMKMHNKNTT